MSALLLPAVPVASAARLAEAVGALLVDQSQASSPAPRANSPRELESRLPGRESLTPATGDLLGGHALAAVIEGSFLVAAADGVSPEEEQALAVLIGQALGRSENETRTALTRLGELLTDQGQQARLGAVAGQLHGFDAREEALSFAALIALADSTLAPEEADTLLELGSHFGFSTGEVQKVVDEIAGRLRAQLA